jgi:hypothetical protein
MALAAKKIRQVSTFIPQASTEILLEAFGPKCFVIMSIHINESHEIRIPPSSAIYSSCKRVLFASRFIHITLTTKSVTTVAGMHLRSTAVSSISLFSNFFIFCILKIP